MSTVLSWLQSFVPVAHAVSCRERLLSCAGALLGLFLAEWISRLALGESSPWFIAPMGASAVLLFAVPSSPLAQPWSIVGGNVVSALVGVTCAKFVGHPGLAAALAVGISIGAMFQLRCLHPPGGAVAVTGVLGGPAVIELGYRFAFWPVAVDSLFLVSTALAFNMAMRRRYPHRAHEQAHPHLTADRVPSMRLGVTQADLNEVLEARGELLDVSSDDLEEILAEAELRAYRRRFGEIRCADIMSGDVVTVTPQASIGEAWALLSRHRVKAMPVVSAQRELVGIVSLHDFFVHRDEPQKLRFFNGIDGRCTVRDLMSPEVVTARAEQPIGEVVNLFSDTGLHHVPVVNLRGAVIGMVTQSDLVAALVRMRLEEPVPAAGGRVTSLRRERPRERMSA